MKFDKSMWNEYAFSDVIDFQEGPGLLAKDFREHGVPLIRLSGMEDNVSLLNGCNYIEEELVNKKYPHFRLKEGDILLSTSATLGKTALVEMEAVGAIAYTGLIRMRPKSEIIYAPFIKYLLQSPSFNRQIETMGVGSVMKHFGPTHLKRINVIIPPVDFQKVTSKLLSDLEPLMEFIEAEQRNLKLLWQTLLNNFVSNKPQFGNLLSGSRLHQYKFSEVAHKVNRRTDPVVDGIKRRIGGENLISGDLKIRTWGVVGKDYVGPAFTFHVLPGDILYVSRNAHLRKVAFADFEGVCSNTTFIIQSSGDKVEQSLLKHVMLSEEFTKYTVAMSKGSTNPYINWKDLDNFTFKVPDLTLQKKMATFLDEILSAIEISKERTNQIKALKDKLLMELLG